jgi:hypothetical protein
MKLKFTALSISSIDMNTVMTLRRNRNPATQREQDGAEDQIPGNGNAGGQRRHLLDLLLRQDDRAQNRDQDQHAGDFERQQVLT